jgi:hypothetical protein
MKRDPGDEQDDKADKYLAKVSDRYFFDESSGLYIQKSSYGRRDAYNERGHVRQHAPFAVKIARDWVPIVISFLTLLLVIGTVYFTRKQWETMNTTLCEIRKQTGYVHDTAAAAAQNASAAQQSLEQARDQFRQDQQPVVWVSQQQNKSLTAVIIVGQPVGISPWYENYGRSSAVIRAYSAYAEIGPGNIYRLHRGAWREAASVLPVGKADEFSFRSNNGGDQVLHGCRPNLRFNRIVDCEKEKCGK